MSRTKKTKVTVLYPVPDGGELFLRTSDDWDANVVPSSGDGERWEFELQYDCPYIEFKPCLVLGDQLHWCQGQNELATWGREKVEIRPYFFYSGGTTATEPMVFTDELGFEFRALVYHPPGYHENLTAHYPIVYMHDEHHVLFPEKAFHETQSAFSRTAEILDSIQVDAQPIICCIWSPHQKELFQESHYGQYSDFVKDVLVKSIEKELRVLKRTGSRAYVGSSLGGVAALHLGWNYPKLFGKVAALSAPFGKYDNMTERVASEEFRRIKIYLDSGWPNETYKANYTLHKILSQRGYLEGRELLHLCYPQVPQDGESWARRLSLVLQFLFPTER